MKTYSENELGEIFKNCSFYKHLVNEMEEQDATYPIDVVMKDEFPADWVFWTDFDRNESELGIDYWEDVNDDWKCFVLSCNKKFIIDYLPTEMYNKI